MTGLVVGVSLALVALLLIGIVPLLSATEQSARAQTAADAAALAGVTSVRDRAESELRGLRLVDLALAELSGSWQFATAVTPMSGFGAAEDYATRNGAVLHPARYSYDASGDRVRVGVELRELAPNDERAEALASASLGLDLAACRFEAGRTVTWTTPPPTPSPTPAPSPGPTPSPTPSPSPPFVSTPVYGPWAFTFSCPGPRGFTESGSSFTSVRDRAADRIHERARPRLVS